MKPSIEEKSYEKSMKETEGKIYERNREGKSYERNRNKEIKTKH